MADENKTERVQLLMTPSELKAIDDWSFENRIRGRAEAMRRLCQMGIGLDIEAKQLAKQASDLGERTRKLLLMHVAALRDNNHRDINQFNEEFVDLLGDVFRHSGFVSRLVEASDISKNPDTEDEISTYKESVKKLLQQRHPDIKELADE